jgi:YggT family protein
MVQILAQVLTVAIIIRALLSWFPIDRRNGLVVLLDQITEPVLAPLRRVVPMVGMIDITPLVAILLLMVIQQLVGSIGYY